MHMEKMLKEKQRDRIESTDCPRFGGNDDLHDNFEQEMIHENYVEEVVQNSTIVNYELHTSYQEDEEIKLCNI